MKKHLFVCLLLHVLTLACASAPAPASAPAAAKLAPAAVVSDAERYARRCQSPSDYRKVWPQGTMLWGTKRDWNTEKQTEERSSVLVSADLASLRLEGGRLVAASASKAGAAPQGVVGTVLQGTASDGTPVEVAICGAEPSAEDPGMVFYRIEAWNPLAQEWENPCVAVDRVPNPRALAVGGVWDASGAHHDTQGKLTFACENGAITKCALWGYKPWARHDGQSLDGVHQACTRLVRADYCGDGRSHTRQDTIIDIYDWLGVSERTTIATREWDPERASFEAAWAPDGATCLARTRDDRALELVLKECPHRFQAGAAVELDAGERCTVRRADVPPGAALLRNRSYGAPKGPASAHKSP